MYNPVKIFSALLLTAVLCGCSSDKIKIRINENEYSDTGYIVKTQIPEISENSDFWDNINRDYTNLNDKTLDNFIKEAENSKYENNNLTMTENIMLNERGFLSIVGECVSDTGEPNKTLSRIVKNIDATKEKELVFSDFFSDDAYKKRINSYIDTLIEENPTDFTELWKKPQLSEKPLFYMTPDSFVLYFPPYELSYYNKGFIEVKIPYDEIRSFMNPEYAERL